MKQAPASMKRMRTTPALLTRKSTRPAGLTLLLLVIALVWVPGRTATADTSRPRSKLQLVQQTPEVGADGVFRILVRVTSEVPDDALVSVSLYSRVKTRSQFAKTLEDSSLGSVLGSRAATLATAEPDPNVPGARLITIELVAKHDCVDVLCIVTGADGVYPVVVEVRSPDGETRYGRFITHLRSVVTPLTQRLNVGLLIPLHLPPGVGPDGKPTRPDTSAFVNLLEALVNGLSSHPLVPVTIRPTPETIDTLSRGSEGDRGLFDQIRTTTSGREVLADSYVRLPTPVLEGARFQTEVNREYALGSNVLRKRLAVEPSTGTLVLTGDQPIPNASALARLGVNRLVLSEDLLQPADPPIGPTRPFVYDAGAAENRPAAAIPAIVIDPSLSKHLSAGDDRVLSVQHLLSDLSVLAYDAPSRPRGVVLEVAGDAITRETFDGLIANLGASSLFSAVTVSELFTIPSAIGADGAVYSRVSKRSATAAAPVDGNAVRLERTRLEGLATLFPDGTPAVAEDLDRRLLVALSSDLRPPDGEKYVANVRRALDVEFAKVTLPTNRRFSITAARSNVFLTFKNLNNKPVRVRVTLRSDRLSFPRNKSRECLAQRVGRQQRSCDLVLRQPTTRLAFPIETRQPGISNLFVDLSTPGGDLPLSRVRYTVRSFAVSGVGIVLTVGALGILAAWWLRHIRRTRRNHRNESKRNGHPANRRPAGGGATT